MNDNSRAVEQANVEQYDSPAHRPDVLTNTLARIIAEHNLSPLDIEKCRRRADDYRPPLTISSPDDAVELLMHKLMLKEQEHLVVLALDTRNKLLGDSIEVYHGSINSSWIRIAEVFREAIIRNAATIIVAHNHPSGDPTPSPEDVAVTKTIVEAGRLLDIECLDHIVIGAGTFTSLKARGLM